MAKDLQASDEKEERWIACSPSCLTYFAAHDNHVTPEQTSYSPYSLYIYTGYSSDVGQ